MLDEPIDFRVKPAYRGVIGHIVLNRPQRLNALNHTMCRQLCEQLLAWQADDEVVAVIIKAAGDRAFCAGGDLRAIYDQRQTALAEMYDFFYDEYRLNAIIHHFSKPYIAFLDGITMGGGAGASVHGQYRIGTERLVFAMPETKIGFFPDVGVCSVLAQCPNHLGLYLALSGRSIDHHFARYLGIVTHLIHSSDLSLLEERLHISSDIHQVLNEVVQLPASVTWDADAMQALSLQLTAPSLIALFEALETGSDCQQMLVQALRQCSPTSLAVTFRHYHLAAHTSFDETLRRDYNIAQHFLTQKDFYEGIRTTLIDRDAQPCWQPMPTDNMLDVYFEDKGRPFY